MPNGKICYIEIPATNIATSSRFYEEVFGWSIRVRGDGARAFDDTTGAVSGTWVTGRPPLREPGLLVYVMVDDLEATLKKVTAGGGGLGTPPTPLGAAGEAFATIFDPAGNQIGVYQERSRS